MAYASVEHHEPSPTIGPAAGCTCRLGEAGPEGAAAGWSLLVLAGALAWLRARRRT